ncbi:hypothetical protein FHR53_002608 [Xanthomonas arboricola]
MDEGYACGAKHDTDGLHGNIANNSALMFLQTPMELQSVVAA